MKKWMALVMVACFTSAAAHASDPPLLDGQPWPTQGGKLVAGHAVVHLFVTWEGTPFLGCIERSSGNADLDSAALRRASAAHPAYPFSRLPSVFEARLPVTFDVPGSPSGVLTLAPLRAQACKPVDLPDYAPAMARRALEAEHIKVITLAADGHIPGSIAPWPRDSEGRPLAGSIAVMGKVENGHLWEGMTFVDQDGPPARQPVFFATAAIETRKVAVDRIGDPPHLATLTVEFRVPTNLQGKTLPIFGQGTPEWREDLRLQACTTMSELAYLVSRDRRNGLTQADALAKAKKIAPGLLTDMLERVTAIVYQAGEPYEGVMMDQFHRTHVLLYCTDTLSGAGARP